LNNIDPAADDKTVTLNHGDDEESEDEKVKPLVRYVYTRHLIFTTNS